VVVVLLPDRKRDTNLPTEPGSLYPVSLALANVGVGIGLSLIGALFFAVLLWGSATLVLAAMVPSVNRTLTRRGYATD
jgi:hypothetical protein